MIDQVVFDVSVTDLGAELWKPRIHFLVDRKLIEETDWTKFLDADFFKVGQRPEDVRLTRRGRLLRRGGDARLLAEDKLDQQDGGARQKAYVEGDAELGDPEDGVKEAGCYHNPGQGFRPEAVLQDEESRNERQGRAGDQPDRGVGQIGQPRLRPDEVRVEQRRRGSWPSRR